MQKRIALLMAICLMTWFFSVGVASGADVAEGQPAKLIFDMEIQDGGENGVSIADIESEGRLAATSLVKASGETDKYIQKVDGVSSDFFVGGITNAHDTSAIYGKEAGENNTNIKYIKFAASRPKNDDDVTTYDYVTDRGNARLVVPLDKSLDIANQDLIFEAWVRPTRDLNDNRANAAGAATNHRDYFDVFSLGSARGAYGATTATTVVEFNWMTRNSSSGGPRFTPQPKTDGSDVYFSFYDAKIDPHPAVGYIDEKLNGQSINGQWTHLVITRKWVQGDSGKGKWESRIYIDGVYRGVKSSIEVTKGDYPSSAASETNPLNHLVIGGSTSSENLTNLGRDGSAFKGDIAEFRLYQGGIDDNISELVEDMYLASKKPYVEAATPAFETDEKVVSATPDSISFTLSGEVDPALITKENVKIKSADGLKELNTGTIEYNAGEVTIPINDVLDYGESYQIWFSKDLKDINGKWLGAYSLPFKTEAFFEGIAPDDSVQIEGYAETLEKSDAVTISVPVVGEGNYVLTMIVYKDGIMNKIIPDANVEAGKLMANTAGIDLDDGSDYKIKAIAWKYDSVEGAVAITRQIILD
ncbi:MAG: Ig-like domain-containing protein [Clostridia bacterium]|nr:Ig-like domain-containing protein [Clostridia bacterium]